jgi:hypothetical protein
MQKFERIGRKFFAGVYINFHNLSFRPSRVSGECRNP